MSDTPPRKTAASIIDPAVVVDHDDFDDERLLRYSRQIMLPDFGIEGQRALARSHVILMGLGGLGSPAALYLAAAGTGRLTLVDDDAVEISNLQRQIIHRNGSIGEKKVFSARGQLQDLNPDTDIHCIDHRLHEADMPKLFARADCVIDGTDNFASRFQINRACVQSRTPLVSAAAIRMEGQLAVFDFRQTDSPCYACLYDENSPQAPGSCSENGILAPVVGVMGCMQALEAIKLLSGADTAYGRLSCFDAMTLQWRTIRLRKDPACPVCGAVAKGGC